MIDCMTCLTQLAQGCPTNGRTLRFNKVTHGMVSVFGSTFLGTKDVPAHGFQWSRPAQRWMFYVGSNTYWAKPDQQ